MRVRRNSESCSEAVLVGASVGRLNFVGHYCGSERPPAVLCHVDGALLLLRLSHQSPPAFRAPYHLLQLTS